MANQCGASLPIQLQLDRGGDLGCSLQLHLCLSLLHFSHPWSFIPFSPFLSLFYPRLISGTHIISRMSVRLAYPVLSPVPTLFPSQIELLVSAFRSSLALHEDPVCTDLLSMDAVLHF